MKAKINEEISVVMYFSAKKKVVQPYLLNWQNRDYQVGEIGYYHSYMEGRDRQHIYELVDKDQGMWFRLRLDSANLHWTLEAVSDGEPS